MASRNSRYAFFLFSGLIYLRRWSGLAPVSWPLIGHFVASNLTQVPLNALDDRSFSPDCFWSAGFYRCLRIPCLPGPAPLGKSSQTQVEKRQHHRTRRNQWSTQYRHSLTHNYAQLSTFLHFDDQPQQTFTLPWNMCENICVLNLLGMSFFQKGTLKPLGFWDVKCLRVWTLSSLGTCYRALREFIQ